MSDEVGEDTGAEVAPDPTHWKCQDCRRPVPTYVGRCPGCRGVNTLRMHDGACPELPRKKPPVDPFAGLRVGGGEPRITVEDRYSGSEPIGDVEDDFEPCERVLTHVQAIDHVLGPKDPGAARGSVILIGGEPGAGKSTVLLQALAGVSERGETTLFVSSEQTKNEIVEYANRLGILSNAVRRYMRIAYTSSWEEVESEIDMHEPSMLALDSLNDFSTLREDSRPGSMIQAVAIMKAVYGVAVERRMASFVVSQVTKDGDFANSKAIQHECHAVACMRLVDDPEERYPIEQVAGSVNGNSERLEFVELCCPMKNRFGKRRIPGYFVVGDSGLLQSVDVPRSSDGRRGSRRRSGA